MQKEEELEDEEPVKKRTRRGLLPREKSPEIKLESVQTNQISKSKSIGLRARNCDSESKYSLSKTNSPPPKTLDSSSAAFGQENEHAKEAKLGIVQTLAEINHDETSVDETASEMDDEDLESEDDKPEIAEKAREKVKSTLKSSGKDPYPDWPPGDPVPYAALCTTFSLVEMTTKRLVISAHCSLFLRQVLRLTPQDLLPTIQLMINKLAADYAGIELGIGESLIMKAIGETTGRSLQVIKADQNEIGDLGLVAAKSRSNQPTMFRPKALTVRGVLDGLMGIAIISGDGSQGRKIAGIKKLLSAADASLAGKGSKGIDITKDKGGASEAKFIIRFLEGKLRLGLAEKTVLVGLAHAMVIHETEKAGSKFPSSEQLAKGEAILKTVYR